MPKGEQCGRGGGGGGMLFGLIKQICHPSMV